MAKLLWMAYNIIHDILPLKKKLFMYLFDCAGS